MTHLRFLLLGLLILLSRIDSTSTPTYAQEESPFLPKLETITPENASQLVEVARFGNGRVMDVEWPAEDERLIVGSTIGVWIVENFSTPPRLLNGHRGMARDVAVSSDGLLITAGDEHGALYLWHGQSGSLLQHYQTGLPRIDRVAISPNNQLVAVGTDDGVIEMLNIQTGLSLFASPASQPPSDFNTLTDLVFSPTGDYLALMLEVGIGGEWGMGGDLGGRGTNGYWELFDVATGEQLSADWIVERYGGNGIDNTLGFNSAGQPVVIVSQLFDPLDFSRQIERSIHDFWTGEVIEINEAVRWLKYADEWAIWDIKKFRKDGEIISVSMGSEILIYKGDSNNTIAKLDYWTPNIIETAIANQHHTGWDTYYFVVHYPELADLELWKLSPEGFQQVDTISYTAESIINLRFASYRGSLVLIFVTNDRLIWFYYVDSGRLIITPLTYFPTDLTFSYDEAIISSDTGWIGPMYRAGDEPDTWVQSEFPINSIHYFPRQDILIYSLDAFGEDCCQLWAYDPVSDQTGVIFDFGDTPIRNMTISNQGNFFATVDGNYRQEISNSELKLYDLTSGQLLSLLWKQERDPENSPPQVPNALSVYSIDFSGDDRLMGASFGRCPQRCIGKNYQTFFRLWDTATQEEVVTISDHIGTVSSLAFSEDDKLIVTSGWDGTIRFWGVPSNP